MSPEDRLAQLERGENPRVITRLKSGFVVMAVNQFLPGSCLLLASPLVGQLLDLSEEARNTYLTDMGRVGAAVKEVTGCLRVNWAIYGNVDPFLHAHIWPRDLDEAEEFRTLPPLMFPEAVRENPLTSWSAEKHGELMAKIKAQLDG